MADENTERRSADMEKAEGDRSTAEENLRNAEESPRTGPDDDRDYAGGITNRTLDEEIMNQQSLAPRGKGQTEERGRTSGRSDNEDIE